MRCRQTQGFISLIPARDNVNNENIYAHVHTNKNKKYGSYVKSEFKKAVFWKSIGSVANRYWYGIANSTEVIVLTVRNSVNVTEFGCGTDLS